MHRKFFTAFAIVVILSMLTTGLAFAKPEIPSGPTSAEATYLKSRSFQQGSTNGHASSTPLVGVGVIRPQAIALGKPGTVYSYSKTFGTTNQPYFDNGDFLNGVPGIAIDGDGSLYAVEENGARLLKWASDGTLLQTHGMAGIHDWGQTDLAWPRDVAIGPDGNVWVADNDSVAWFNPDDLTFLGRFPAEPWNAPDENRFQELRGIAFDQAGHLFLADRWRQRIQVYTLGDGDPQYLTTIGMSDQWVEAGDNSGFHEPGQIVVDSSNNLYVADSQNARVQVCSPEDETFIGWYCGTVYGGTWGSGDNEMMMPWGLGISANDDLYITDNGNGRVLLCFYSADVDFWDCSPFVTGLNWPTDIVIRADGGGYISTYDDYTIREFFGTDSMGDIFAGSENTPYTTGVNNFNGPRALDIDAGGNIYLAEEWGQRMLKLSPKGAIVWMTGEPGRAWGDAIHLSFPSALAVNPTRTKMIVVGGGSRVEWYNPANGAHLKPPVNFLGNWGEGNYEFKQARGVAFDPAGNFYIADSENQRVMMYNSKGVFVRQLGVTNERGLANDHFNWPNGVTVDKAGNLYVADHDNCRVQKFNKYGKFMMTFGTTLCGWEVDRMGGPVDVAVDAGGRVFVAEEWNQRVKVFSSTGAYLATIAGKWGSNTGDLRNPVGVAVDAAGAVYVSDQNNARIQKYTAKVPFAAQVSLDSFGQRERQDVFAVASFKNQIYAGTSIYNGGGAQIWRKGAYGWEEVVPNGFDDGANGGIDHLFVYQGYLYASTYNCFGENCSQSNGGQLWRSSDGSTWLPVIRAGFGNPNNAEIFRMAVLNKKLCASTWSLGGGSEIWCSATGDPETWELEAEGGFGNADNEVIPAMIEFNGVQYAGTRNTNLQSSTAGEVYSRTGGGEWTKIDFPAFQNAQGGGTVFSFAIYKTYLYAVTSNASGGGSQIWRCKATCSGSDWKLVGDNGFGDANNRVMPSLAVTPTTIYAVFGNMGTGLEIRKSVDGLKWTQVSTDGLGSTNNTRIYWNNGLIAVGYNLYLGTINNVNGGAVWKICTTSACS